MAWTSFLAQFLHSRQPVTTKTMMIIGLAGVFVGCTAGYVGMGTLHAVFEMGTYRHFQHGEPIVAAPTAKTTVQVLREHESTAVYDAAATTDVSTQVEIARDAGWPSAGSMVHTLCTSNGSPYVNFQNRIMYATYQLAQKEPGGEVHVGFTRILHRTVEDDLMKEIPTFHAMPLTPKCDGWCEFPVADRPNAVRQFFSAAAKDASMIKAPWIFLIETDYVWMGPLANVPRAEAAVKSWAFPYGYIVPTHPSIKAVMREMYPEARGPLSNVPNTGPAPVLMRAADWLRVAPDWERLSAHIEVTPEAKDKLGWVREMYAFSIAAALNNVAFELQLPPRSPLMVQPPADHNIGAAALMHYTWGSIFHDKHANDAEVWKFDKRFFTAREVAMKVPQLEEPPEWREGLTLQDGVAVTRDLVALLRAMVRRMNEASRDLPVILATMA